MVRKEGEGRDAGSEDTVRAVRAGAGGAGEHGAGSGGLGWHWALNAPAIFNK